jgi:hypothetical protein
METNNKTNSDIEMDEIKDIKLSVEFANILNAISLLKKNIVIIQNNIRTLEKNVKVKCNRLKNKKKTTNNIFFTILIPRFITKSMIVNTMNNI